MSIRLIILYILLFLSNLSEAQISGPILPKREFRGVWVATVANIDWPSKPGLPVETQQRELLQLLDEHQQSGMNAIMFQIRPAADAYYAKSKEPWSKYLNGKQGKAPTPFYDPLEFAIQEAHKRGIELHAWFNPYRAAMNLNIAELAPNHIIRQHPEWFFNYDGKKLFNPGIPEAREYIVSVVLDVVKNYDIDGVHFDDYFYPYPETGQVVQDAEQFRVYGGEFDNIGDWRRNNVDLLIKELSDSIHTVKRFVKFGISPFGIWRNKNQDPEGSESTGLQGYTTLYADARKWVKEGWIDYVNPQVYFPFFYRAAPFEKLVDWWSNNSFGKHVYIGQGAYRATEKREGWTNWSQLPDQVRYIRQNPRVQGSVYFSSKSLTKNLAGFQDSLRTEFYRFPSLPPLMIWLDDVPPLAPLTLQATMTNNGFCVLNWQEPYLARDNETAYGYVIYRFGADEPINTEDASKILRVSYDKRLTSFTDYTLQRGKQYQYVVTALDRVKNESPPSNTATASY